MKHALLLLFIFVSMQLASKEPSLVPQAVTKAVDGLLIYYPEYVQKQDETTYTFPTPHDENMVNFTFTTSQGSVIKAESVTPTGIIKTWTPGQYIVASKEVVETYTIDPQNKPTSALITENHSQDAPTIWYVVDNSWSKEVPSQ